MTELIDLIELAFSRGLADCSKHLILLQSFIPHNILMFYICILVMNQLASLDFKLDHNPIDDRAAIGSWVYDPLIFDEMACGVEF